MTGNTKDIANKLSKDINVEAFSLDDVTPQEVSQNDLIIFGSPAMGNEELDEDSVRPFMEELKPLVDGKKFALFGSYGWGDGQWMNDWKTELKSLAIDVIATLTVNGDSSSIKASEYEKFIEAIK